MAISICVIWHVFDLHEKLTFMEIILHQRNLVVTVRKEEESQRGYNDGSK